MEKTVHVNVPFRPMPKPSARRGRFGSTYMPREAKDYMEMVRDCITRDALEIMSKNMHLPVSVILICSFQPVKRIRENPDIVHEFCLKNKYTKKPDFDNLEKMAMDALKGFAWKDDSQIFKCTTIKQYGAKESTNIVITYHE